jgi:hypothetical protein
MNDAVENRALALAAAQFLCFEDEIGEDWFKGYEIFRDAVEKGVDPEGVQAWSALAGWPPEEVLDHIQTEAQSIEVEMMAVLELAKAGIVHKAIECELDSDMNMLDMRNLVEVGQELDEQ